MSCNIPLARHVFHVPTTGWDRIHAWKERTEEPVFVWGRQPGASGGIFFAPVLRDFRNWIAATNSTSITVYHDGAGADAFGALDPARHKILRMHEWVPRWERYFDNALRSTGKVLVGNESQAQSIHTRFQWIPERFIHVLGEPSLQTSLPADRIKSAPKLRTGIWLHGRNWRKYGNRLRSLADCWPAEKGQLEFVVGGNKKPSWAQKDHIVWSMSMPMEFALYRLYTWDSVLLLNDFNLDAPWFRLALSFDCFPLIPEGDSLSRTPVWSQESAPRPYEWGDFSGALDLLDQWRQNREKVLPEFRNWVKRVCIGDSEPLQFQRNWQDVKRSLIQQRTLNLKVRPPVGRWYPLCIYESLSKIRSGH